MNWDSFIYKYSIDTSSFTCIKILIMKDKDFLSIAIDEAFKGVRGNKGGPFGAVIVLNGEIIGRGFNMVTSTNDPTAHAEIIAIRDACKNLNTFNLENAVLYTSCEPCPMCLSAVYWAGIKTVYYSSDQNDAEKIGFSDKFIYDELKLDTNARSVKMNHIDLQKAKELFKEWEDKNDKIEY